MGDRFLHKIQQEKMKELWDNRFDEGWGERDKNELHLYNFRENGQEEIILAIQGKKRKTIQCTV